MPDKRRIRRLEQVVLQTVAPLLSHGLSDPRLGLVTVTHVKLSSDLSVARVNWSCIGSSAERSKAAHALESARGPIQAAIADRMQTRVTPRVHFHYDESVEKAARVNEILTRLERERAEREGEPAEGEEAPDRDETEPEA